MTLAGLVVRYAGFAALATALNLGVQRLVLLGGRDTVHFAAAVDGWVEEGT